MVHEAVWKLSIIKAHKLGYLRYCRDKCTSVRRPGHQCRRLVCCHSSQLLATSFLGSQVAAKHFVSGSAGGPTAIRQACLALQDPVSWMYSPAKRAHLPISSLSVSSPSSRSDPIAEAATELKPCREHIYVRMLKGQLVCTILCVSATEVSK